MEKFIKVNFNDEGCVTLFALVPVSVITDFLPIAEKYRREASEKLVEGADVYIELDTFDFDEVWQYFESDVQSRVDHKRNSALAGQEVLQNIFLDNDWYK